jgi:HEAT repeat protein
LGNIGDPRAVDPLIAALEDQNSAVQESAATALGELKDSHAIEPLIATLKDTDSDLRSLTTKALVKIGTPAVEPLIAALKDTNANVRRNAAQALGQIKDPRAVEPLLAELTLRDAAAIAGDYIFFIKRGESGSEDVLIEALNLFGGEGMAQDFLNCGNARLEDAGSAWATRHGYQIFPGYGLGGSSLRWGSE